MAPRSQYPPFDFQCPYKDACPHLQFSSTHWIWSEYERSYEEASDHWKVRDELNEELDNALVYISQLERENEELKAKLKALHQRQFKAHKKPKEQSALNEDGTSDKATKNKKRGAPKGHPGWFRRKPDHIDKTIMVEAPTVCPHCSSSDLTAVEGIKEHLQEDIVLQPKTAVISFQHQQAFCKNCSRVIVKAAEGELPNCAIGPVTKAAAVFLRYGLRIPYRKVQELFNVFFNMPFVPASAMAFDRNATVRGKPLYDDLKEKLQSASVAFADETYWRQDGIGHYVWYGGNEDLAVFHIDRHRSAKVALSILGNDFDGILHTDGYAVYNRINPKAHQSCLAHLIRKAKEIKQEIVLQHKRYHDHEAIRFCDEVVQLFKKACGINRKIKNAESKHSTAYYKKQLYGKLKKICSKKLSVAKAETLRGRLIEKHKEYHRLFTFLDFPEGQPTNNHAEQSLRTMVIFRKICFGTRSADGSFSHSVLPSLIVTAQRQGKHPLKFLQTLFTSDTSTAHASLFDSS